MQPFNSTLEQVSRETLLGGTVESEEEKRVSLVSGPQRRLLEQEPWFHGAISRRESEALVVADGEFLVRESQGSAGQYVLTGMQGAVRKHLLLVDPEGVVRTKDKTFESVSHLINYHRDNGLPIISAESALVLRNPVSACP
jgi:SHC-transforming protein 1